jgi:O-succinylbenzoic acid--CoA ligase
MERELRTFAHAVWSTYGMTETLSHIALRRISGPDASDWSTPFSFVEITQNADGCLVINAPEVSADTLVTNDIVEIENNRFRILGRKDYVICSGGIKLQIEEIERELKPYVRVPYIISKKKNEKFGEIVVLLTEGDTDEARAICEEHLPKYHRPKLYQHIDQIPLTETGKPARKKILELISR